MSGGFHSRAFKKELLSPGTPIGDTFTGRLIWGEKIPTLLCLFDPERKSETFGKRERERVRKNVREQKREREWFLTF